MSNGLLKNGWFYDWLSMGQTYDYQLPIVASVVSVHTETDTGEQFNSRQPLKHQGSFDTRLIITCDGSRVKISGNPSRYDRPDNLFGFTNIDDCVEVYNRVLVANGLPELTKTTKVEAVWDMKLKKFRQVPNGAIVTQIHVTKNFSVGLGNEQNFVRSLGSFSYRGKAANIYPDCNTADWLAGSSRLYFKFYNKHISMLRERKKLVSKYESEQLEYYDRVLEYCRLNGVVRAEYEFKSDYLRDRGMRYYGYSDITQVQNLTFLQDIIKKLEVVVSDYSSVADDLLHHGIVTTRQAANATQCYFMMWLHGQDLKRMLKKSQWYTHRSRLLHLGYDIAERVNVSAMPIRLNQSKTLDLVDLEIPDWYEAV